MSDEEPKKRPLDSYEVGYGKPPRVHQFKPGQSGNPRGKPKGLRSWKTIFDEVMNQKVTINENGKEKRISMRELLYRKLAHMGAKGDYRALNKVLDMDAKLLAINEQKESQPQPGLVVLPPDLEYDDLVKLAEMEKLPGPHPKK